MGESVSPPPLSKANVAAVVVTYHPDSQFPERLGIVARQVNLIVVIDNHSSDSELTMLEQCTSFFNATLLKNENNLGIAAALNAGVEYVMRCGYSWALLLDQDTIVGENLIEGIGQSYMEFPQKDRLGLIGSNYIDPSTGNPRKPPQLAGRASWMERRTVITSGTLLPTTVYRVLGPFREDYFIDCVDLEYCLRARAKQLKVIMTAQALMTHDVGHTTMHKIGWKKTGTSNHSPLRRYYMIRNQVSMAKEYILSDPIWLAVSLWTSLKSMVSICLFENQRTKKLKFAALGLLDGVRSKFDRQLI